MGVVMSAIVGPIRAVWGKGFVPTLLVTAIWINVSEVFRYFAFVMPMMRKSLPMVENVAPMSLGIFAMWGVWDTVLLFAVTGFVWLFLDRVGRSARSSFVAGTYVWLAIFVILWLGLYNMNLATLSIVLVALGLSWVEMIVAALVVNWGMGYFGDRRDA